jgi:hypothetical protein
MNRRSILRGLSAASFARRGKAQAELPDLSTVAPDLEAPTAVEGKAGAGRRVLQIDPDYQGAQVRHTLYLPRDWKPGRQYPVIVEYAGNGLYKNSFGDVSTGEVEGSKLGYGISGGNGFIWVCMPYVNALEKKNQITWWGDVDATVRYAGKTIRQVCGEYGGDPSAIILAGFSRGAIACNYIGLHDEHIAGIWRAFVAYSHYDGVITTWPYPGADRASALQRLARLNGRPVFVCDEKPVESTRAYIESTGIRAPFTYQQTGFRNHNDAWALRDIPARQAVRRWLADVLVKKPA